MSNTEDNNHYVKIGARVLSPGQAKTLLPGYTEIDKLINRFRDQAEAVGGERNNDRNPVEDQTPKHEFEKEFNLIIL